MGNRFQAWFLRRMEALASTGEGMEPHGGQGCDRDARAGASPLVRIPAGIVSRGNDRLGSRSTKGRPSSRSPRTAGEEAAGSTDGRSCTRAAVPVYLGSLEETVAPVLDRRGQAHLVSPGPKCAHRTPAPGGQCDPRAEELELVGEFREGAIEDRLGRLIDDILVPIEVKWKVKKRDADRAPHGCVPCGRRSSRSWSRARSTRPRADRRWMQLAALPGAAALALPWRLPRRVTEPRAHTRDGRATRGRPDRRGHRFTGHYHCHHPGSAEAHRGPVRDNHSPADLMSRSADPARRLARRCFQAGQSPRMARNRRIHEIRLINVTAERFEVSVQPDSGSWRWLPRWGSGSGPQSLLGARGMPESCVGDALHRLTAGLNAWLAEVPQRADALLILSSLVIDLVGVFLLARSIVRAHAQAISRPAGDLRLSPGR